MPNVISFNALTLASKERIWLGPPAFKKLRKITIAELRTWRKRSLPSTFVDDMPRLRAMSPDVEELEIGTLTLLRGGINIRDVEFISMAEIYTDTAAIAINKLDNLNVNQQFEIGDPDSEESCVTVGGSGSIKMGHVGTMQAEKFFKDGVGHTTDVTLILPKHVEPTHKWAPVQGTKRPKLTAG